MKNCTKCRHAVWKKTDAGKMHPSGDGKCTKTVKIPELPQAFYWCSMYSPRVSGSGTINRRKELRDHCVYFEEATP